MVRGRIRLKPSPVFDLALALSSGADSAFTPTFSISISNPDVVKYGNAEAHSDVDNDTEKPDTFWLSRGRHGSYLCLVPRLSVFILSSVLFLACLF